MLHHPFDLAILAFGQAHRDPGVGALNALEPRVDRRIANVVDRDARLERVEPRLVDGAVNADAVAARPAGRGEFERARKPPVVGEQKQPLGVDVETPDADDARKVRVALREIGEHCRAPFGIVRGGDITRRLVKEKEPRALALLHRRAVDLDFVAFAHVEGGTRQDAAIDGDAALRDPVFRVAPRADAGARHDLGDALALEGFFARRRRRRRFRAPPRGAVAAGSFRGRVAVLFCHAL